MILSPSNSGLERLRLPVPEGEKRGDGRVFAPGVPGEVGEELLVGGGD